jgi:predicted transcriptional regulator
LRPKGAINAAHDKEETHGDERPALIGRVHSTFVGLSGTQTVKVAAAVGALSAPAVPIKKSVADGYIVCLEDGHKFQSLKRHLKTGHNLTPDAYREKWRLPNDYPMVARAFAKARSSLATSHGLGQERRGHKKIGD